MRVGEAVEHILLHINAEVGDTDESQVGDVAARAVYVKGFLEPLQSDDRDLDRESLLGALSAAAPGGSLRQSFRRVAVLIGTDEGIFPQLAIQTWVGTGFDG